MTYLKLQVERDGTIQCEGLKEYSFGHRFSSATTGDFDGIHCSWQWDGARLLATTDRYGIAPLYYACLPNGIAISPKIPTLVRIGSSTALDYDALAVFLRTTNFVEEDTPFKSIRAMPPNGKLIWKGSKLEVSGGVIFTAPQSLSRSAALDAYIEAFRNAIRRRVSDGRRLVLPLSGGRDSRHILLELCAQGRNPEHCVTASGFPDRTQSNDVRIAELICQRLGQRHVVLPPPKSRVHAALWNAYTSNFCSPEHSWTLGLTAYLEERAEVVFDGLGGDILSAGFLYSPERLDAFVSGNPERVMTSLAFRSEAQICRVLSRSAYKELDIDRAVARIGRVAAKHLAANNPVTSYFFWNRTRRSIAMIPYAILANVGTVYTPYLDHEVFDLLSSLPPAIFEDHAFHEDAIVRAYPKFVDVPYAAPTADNRAFTKHIRDSLPRMLRIAIRLKQPFIFDRARFVRLSAVAIALPRLASRFGWYLQDLLYVLALETLIDARLSQSVEELIGSLPSYVPVSARANYSETSEQSH